MYYFAFKVPMKQNFLFFSYERVQKIWKTVVYHFSVSYLVLELKSFADAKVKAKSMDTKHVILVMSHTLNKYSMDFKTTI